MNFAQFWRSTMGQQAITIERLKDFMSFVLLSYNKVLHFYQVSSSYFLHLGDTGRGHFDPPWSVTFLTKLVLSKLKTQDRTRVIHVRSLTLREKLTDGFLGGSLSLSLE